MSVLNAFYRIKKLYIPWQDRQQRSETEDSYTLQKCVHSREWSIEHLLFSTNQRESELKFPGIRNYS